MQLTDAIGVNGKTLIKILYHFSLLSHSPKFKLLRNKN